MPTIVISSRVLAAAVFFLLLLCLYLLQPRLSTQWRPAGPSATSCGALREEFCISLKRFREGDGVVWFQHLHKAGGTIFCRMALANVDMGYHRNCNPVNGSNEFYPLWLASAAEQRRLAREAETKLVANEQYMSRDRVPAGDMFTYVTLVRDPLDRWLSNAYFEKQKKAPYTDQELLRIMARSEKYFADNLAVRAFAGKPTGPVDEQDLAYAQSVLRDFTIAAPTELYPLARVLFHELLGWNWTTLHLHENLNRIRSGNVRASDARRELSPALLARLRQRERLDLALYDFTVRLFMEQLAAWARLTEGAAPLEGDYTSRWMEFLRSNDVPRSQYRSALSPLAVGGLLRAEEEKRQP